MSGKIYLLELPSYRLIEMSEDFYKILQFAVDRYRDIHRSQDFQGRKDTNYYGYLDKKRALIGMLRPYQKFVYIDEVPARHSDIFLGTSWPILWVVLFLKGTKLRYAVYKKGTKYVFSNDQYQEIGPIESFKGLTLSEILEYPQLIYSFSDRKKKLI